jgi:hypothetical protein
MWIVQMSSLLGLNLLQSFTRIDDRRDSIGGEDIGSHFLENVVVAQ